MDRKSRGFVGDPPTAAIVAHRKAAKKENKNCGIKWFFLLILIAAGAVYLFAFGGLAQVQALLEEAKESLPISDTPAPTGPPVEVPLFPEIIREGDNYVGLVFLSDFNDAIILNAFTEAAQTWSDIVDGTQFPGFNRQAGELLCSTIPGSAFNATVDLENLVIVADISPIDGVGRVLGSAGPCFRSISTGLVLSGQMNFDIADVSNLIQQNSLRSVILHEMGHVLGIGTGWIAFNRLIDPVFSGNGNNIVFNANARPGFTGPAGLAQYRLLTGNNAEAFIPVEDGIDEGNNNDELFDRAALEGRGSIDGHWDKDFMEGELMEFQIAPNSQPPLSATSIASLQDLGYTVNIGLAQSYTPPSFVNAKKLRGAEVKTEYIVMLNDINLDALEDI